MNAQQYNMFSILKSNDGSKYLIRQIMGDGTDTGFIKTFSYDYADDMEKLNLCIKCAGNLGFRNPDYVGKILYEEMMVSDDVFSGQKNGTFSRG